MSDCRFGVLPVNYPDPDPVINPLFRYKDRFIVNQYRSLRITQTNHCDAGLYICTSGSQNETDGLFIHV